MAAISSRNVTLGLRAIDRCRVVTEVVRTDTAHAHGAAGATPRLREVGSAERES